MSRVSWKQTIKLAQEEALLAVKLYNDPYLPRSFEGFVVHMHLAWLYLLQSKFIKNNVEIRIPLKSFKTRFEMIDGEFKYRDLSWMVSQNWISNPTSGVKANLEFFIKLRNKIEHRYRKVNEIILRQVMGQSHSLLLNFEEEISNTFGLDYSLAYKLTFPVFIGTFTQSSENVLVRLRNKLPLDIGKFIAKYESDLDPIILQSREYSLTLDVSLRKVNSHADMVVNFIHAADIAEDALVGGGVGVQQGTVIKSVKTQEVINRNLLKAGQVVLGVQQRIPYIFKMHHLQKSISFFDVRAGKNAQDPSITKQEYCVWDVAHKDYVYKQHFVDFLVAQLSSDARFLEITGKIASPR